jgi:zinc/manganese transport system substrate-binding protein
VPSSDPDPSAARTSRRRALHAGAVLGCLGLLATGCSGSTGSGSAGSTGTRKVLSIVAGENFWGSIVAQLAGRAATVTSIVSDPNADPHNYESSSNNARTFADADYVVLNGAGYDTWAHKLISANPSAKRTVLTIADLLGKKEGDNPHFWYDPAFVTKVADQVTADLKRIDPADAAYFDTQRSAFTATMAPVSSTLAAIKARFAGTHVASTESIVAYLADYLGLNLVSPPEFMNAVAEGNDPPSPSVVTFDNLLRQKQVKLLVFNKQTTTDVTTNLQKLAASHGIPVVGVTETIQPRDATFEEWFGAELIDLQNALDATALSGA